MLKLKSSNTIFFCFHILQSNLKISDDNDKKDKVENQNKNYTKKSYFDKLLDNLNETIRLQHKNNNDTINTSFLKKKKKKFGY